MSRATEVDEQDLAVPLDSLLANVSRTGLPDVLPGAEVARWFGALAKRPSTTGSRLVSLGSELGRIIAGTSTISASTRDRRFVDEAWTGNPVLRRCLQAYLATSEKALQLVDDAELDERTELRLRLVVENLIDALAPSNNLLLNPVALKETLDTGGANLRRGLGHFVSDASRRPRVPSMVDTSQFDVGVNVGATPGAVVLRTPVLEVIQYAPTTERVREVPFLIVPPTINKFYVLDLAPGRSFVEYLVSQGQQVFMVSWRNPGAQHASWNLDTYIHGVLEAIAAVQALADVDRVALQGTCSGGIIASMAAAHLSATGRSDAIAALTLAVTVLDQARSGSANALIDRRRAEMAAGISRRAGYLDGAALAEVFAWLRPNDLIWNYWVNNYLMGRKPPAFDVLFWNADTTRMPAALHRDFLDVSIDNPLVTPGHATALGVPVDLGKITADAYIIGGETDHITPWQSCYRSAHLLGGSAQFVLSTSGHIAALVNPADNPRSSYRTATEPPQSAGDFLTTAETCAGSWWAHHAEWLQARTGKLKPAPRELGTARYRPLADAPGTYVFDS
jgi:polyhydroxyalkanoate synthase subunit PhaC